MGMMTSSNGNIFHVTGPLCGEFTGHRWIPRTKASDAELWCFLWSAPWINGWVNNHKAGDLRCHRAHYDVIVMGLTAPGYVEHQPSMHLCQEGQRQLGHTHWHRSPHIQTMYVPDGLTKHKSALTQIMVMVSSDIEPLPEPMITKMFDAIWHH